MKEIRFVDLSGEKAFSFTDPPFASLRVSPPPESVPVFRGDPSEGRWHPLCPRQRVAGPLLLTVRLWESHSERGGFYAASDEAWECVNQARRHPLFRGVLEWFEWTPPQLWPDRPWADSVPEMFRQPGMIFQGGSQVANWWGKVISPAPDPARDALRPFAEWWERLGYREDRLDNVRKQGNLLAVDLHLVAEISDEVVEAAEKVLSSYSILSASMFLNHYLVGGHSYARRVFGGYWYQFLHVYGPSCLVLSSDHPLEPLVLDKGAHLLLHPRPSRPWAGAD